MSETEASRYSVLIKLEDVDGESYFVGRVQEWPDVEVFEKDAKTAYETTLAIIDDLRGALKEQGTEVPTPYKTEREYSGRFTARTPKWLHRDLAEAAEREGASFNQYILSILAKASGISDTRAKMPILSTTFIPTGSFRLTIPHGWLVSKPPEELQVPEGMGSEAYFCPTMLTSLPGAKVEH